MRLSPVVALAFLSALVMAISLLGPPKASAAPGDPFDPLTPYVFVGQNAPTELYRAVAGAGGTVTFAPEGGAVVPTYNAIGYNTNDNYLYGIVLNGNGGAIPNGSVIRIGQGGVVTRVGTSTVSGGALWGSFDEGNNLYVGRPTSNEFSVVDSTTGAVTSTATMSVEPDVVDLTYAAGYFWSINSNGDLVRVDLKNAAAAKPVAVFPLGLPAGSYGAAWTFGNGNIGVSHNTTGTVTQIAIENPGSASPIATIVSTSPGPGSSNNDGAASPGAPTDLTIVKDAPTSYTAGESFTYTVTVTNDGPGLSTGSVVNDLVPAGLSNVTTTTPGCTVVSNQVTCTVGQLASGESAEIEITVDTPTSTDQCFTNEASVLANEVDPDPASNVASVTSCPRALSVTKSSTATTATRVGDTVTYTVTATNTGLGSYTLAEPAVLFDDLTGILDDATYGDDATATVLGVLDPVGPKISWTGPLGPGASVSLEYTVTTTAGGDGVMRNVAFVPNDPSDPQTPGCAPPNAAGQDPVTGEPCAQLTNGLPALTIVKSASPTAVTAIGDTITYSYVITNTGGLTLDPVSVTETAFSGTGTAPVPTCPVTTLAPGASTTCTATYVATEDDINAGSIANTAVGNGTPPSGPPIESPPSSVTVTTPGGPPPLTVTKSSTASATTRVGDTVTYTVTATNTGLGSYTAANPAVVVDDLAGVIDDGTYNDDAAADRPGTIDYSAPKLSWSGPLGAGQTVTLTYSVVAGTNGDGVMRNVAFQPNDPTDPQTPNCAPPNASGQDPVTGEPCATVSSPVPSLSIVKTADRATVTTVGETITFSYLITNTGGITLAPVAVTETAFSGTGPAPVPTCPAEADSLAPGASVTCTASYVATEADVHAGAISNTAVGTGTPPGGPPIESPPSTVRITTPGPPAPPAPPAAPRYDLSMTKSATRKQVTVGDTITYRLFVKNHGPDAAEGVRVTDKLPRHLDLQDARTPQGACTVRGNEVDCAVGKLDDGQSVTVLVRATALRSGSSTNTATVRTPDRPDGTPSDPPANNVGTARVRIVKPQLRVRKTSSRRGLRAGETTTYTIRVTNPSRRAVRNVRTCDRLPSGLLRVSTRPTAQVSRGRHCWTAKRIPAGKSVTYRITVRALSGVSGRKTNVAQATSPDARRGRATRSIRVIGTPARAGGVTG